MSVLQLDDTIAAVATAPGRAAISIVRLSGPDGLRIADRLIAPGTRLPSTQPAGSFFKTRLFDPDQPGQLLDHAIILIFRAPHSYTGDDVVEFQLHGGPIQSRRLLRVLLCNGARLATPGEFTQRAFLKGKLDLVQAEGIADLIQSQSERAAILAVEQIEGNLSHHIKTIYDEIMTVSSDVEMSLDFSDAEFPIEIFHTATAAVNTVITRVDTLLDSWDQGRMVREGVLVVITGSPNVGKSTLLNKLLGYQRAIVTDIPGTTRDSIEEGFLLDGVQIRLTDTAGIRDTECKIEKMGINRASDLLGKADVIIKLIDASQIDKIRSIGAEIEQIGENTILFANKIDLAQKENIALLSFYSQNIISGSLINEVGIDELKRMLSTHIQSRHPPVHSFSISERHRDILAKAQAEIRLSSAKLLNKRSEDLVLVSTHLRTALELLGTITGQVYTDQLLETIFSRFCVGK